MYSIWTVCKYCYNIYVPNSLSLALLHHAYCLLDGYFQDQYWILWHNIIFLCCSPIPHWKLQRRHIAGNCKWLLFHDLWVCLAVRDQILILPPSQNKWQLFLDTGVFLTNMRLDASLSRQSWVAYFWTEGICPDTGVFIQLYLVKSLQRQKLVSHDFVPCAAFLVLTLLFETLTTIIILYCNQ